nr:TPA_asm: polymerase [Zostera ophiovirus]
MDQHSANISDLLERYNINELQHPCVFKLLIEMSDHYSELYRSIRNEDEMESEPVSFEIPIKHNHLVNVNFDYWILTKESTPALITKIDSPYKSLSDENIEMMLGNLYPEKWSKKDQFSLYHWRTAYLSDMKSLHPINHYNHNQYSAIHLYKRLMKIASPSVECADIFTMSKMLYSMEADNLSQHLTEKNMEDKYHISENIEMSEESCKIHWVLDIFETINKMIKINSSSRENRKKIKRNVSFYEGKRINVLTHITGNSLVLVEFKDYPEMNLNMFISNVISSYNFADEDIVHVGRLEMLSYTMFITDNMMTLNMMNDINLGYVERSFLEYMKSLLDIPETSKRVGLAGLYEQTCLLMSDYRKKSSSMPLMDNLIESIKVSPFYTEKLVNLCLQSSVSQCIRMSLAETDTEGGLQKNPVNENTIKRLRSLFRKKVIIEFIKKYGVVPKLYDVPESLAYELEKMASSSDYSNLIISDLTLYNNLTLGKFLEPGQEINLQTRIIDKACTSDNYNSHNNTVKEISYYIGNDISKIREEELYIFSSDYQETRNIKIVDRKDEILFNHRKHFLVRLSEKEKELKEKARYFGIASFNLKLWVSTMMEFVKRAMKLLPGQMMTMTDDKRRETMHKMSMILAEDDSYSLFLDYSGHNTSQRPENTLFLLEEIANMYGSYSGEPFYEKFTSLAYLFSNITVISEDKWRDSVYYSKGQKGAIEGWFGSLWGIQSQLMLEDMFSNMGMKQYIATTYSDDSCGVFVQKNMDRNKLNNIIQNIQRFGSDMGLLVKLSQTQVTNGRCSMLKEHYTYEEYIETNYKKFMSISPNGSGLLYDDQEMSGLIDSGYNSACFRSTEIHIQTILRNYRVLKLLASSFKRFLLKIPEEVELDHRFLVSNKNYVREMLLLKAQTKDLTTDFDMKSLPTSRHDTVNFIHFHRKNIRILELLLMLMYAPTSCYGYSLTPMPDTLISGYSLSNVKRISYIQGFLKRDNSKLFGKLINPSTNARQYLTTPFPLSGGFVDTKTLLNDILKLKLKEYTRNPDLLKYMSIDNDESEEEFDMMLLRTFKDCFSCRITGKYKECTIFNYISEILNKIDSSGTMKMMLGGKILNKIRNKAWSINYNRKVKLNKYPILDYDHLFLAREHCLKYMKNDEIIQLKFIGIEELPVMGKLVSFSHDTIIQPINVPNTQKINNKICARPPVKSHTNLAKFEREIGIEGFFKNKLIFMAFDLVRYTKWILMELKKYSKISDDEKLCLIEVCNRSLSTFSHGNYYNLEKYVTSPKGGRFFHRALTANFNPKTGDLSSNKETTKWDLSRIRDFIMKSGGKDHNVNLQYVMTYLRVSLSITHTRKDKALRLTLTEDVMRYAKDVTFNLFNIGYPSVLRKLKESNIIKVNELIERGPLYLTFSNFIAVDEDLEKSFINQLISSSETEMTIQTAYINIKRYMDNSFESSVCLIPEKTLRKLVPNLEDTFGSKENLYHLFYKFYAGLNIIESDTPSKCIIRSILYDHMYLNPLQPKWFDELMDKGYSNDMRFIVLRLFIMATSMIYKLDTLNNGNYKLHIMEKRTLENTRKNIRGLKSGKLQIYTRDQKIFRAIVDVMPILSYEPYEITEQVHIVYEMLNKMNIHQNKINEYFSTEFHHYIEKNDNNVFGNIMFREISVTSKDLVDKKGLSSAVRAYEMICALSLRPKHLSSPTMSDIYPTAISLIQTLKNNRFIRSEDQIIDLFGGRGDFHLAMIEEKVDHISISRNDGYNIINRIIGMREEKSNFNSFDRNNYMNYIGSSIFLIDASHVTNTKDCLKDIIDDMKFFKKKVIIRLNTMIKYFDKLFYDQIKDVEMNCYVPYQYSPGIIYLTIDFNKRTQEFESSVKGYHRSLLSEMLTNDLNNITDYDILNRKYENVIDHTEEHISDEKLIEMLLVDKDEEYKINENIIAKLLDETQCNAMQRAFIDNNLFEKYRNKLIIPSIDNYVLDTSDTTDKIDNLYDLYYEESRALKSNVGSDLTPEIKVSKELLLTGKNIIDGCKDISADEFLDLSLNVINNTKNSLNTRSLWLAYFHNIKNDEKVSTSLLKARIRQQKFKDQRGKAINEVSRAARYAVTCYRNGIQTRGLKEITKLSMLSKDVLLKNKFKATKNLIVNYKLIYNRLLKINEKYDLKLIAKDYNIEDHISYYTGDKVKHIIDEHEAKLLTDIESTGILNFLNDKEEDTMFNCMRQSDIMNVKFKALDIHSKEIEKEKLFKEVEGDSVFGMFKLTDEEIERNKNMTIDDCKALLEEGGIGWEEDDDYEDEE